MARHEDASAAIKMATDIVIAYLAQRSVEPEELPRLLSDVRHALESDLPPDSERFSRSRATRSEAERGPDVTVEPAVAGKIEPADAAAAALRPAVPVKDSVHDDYLISLEDGGKYRSLRRHLMAKYKMTPDDYRRKWGLPDDYPMVCPSYSRDRSQVALRSGLGRKSPPKPSSKARSQRKSA